jgi:uroporphyrinogen-III synthase
MTVLVTRPDEQGKALCHQLASAGIKTCHQPLMQFCFNSDAPDIVSQLRQSDIVICVSQAAVAFSQHLITQQGGQWPNKATYLAIGQKTAQLLSKQIQQAVNYPEISDSEHLLALPQLRFVHSLTILILRGVGGRELIAEQLRAKGANVIYGEVYERKPIALMTEHLVQQWKKENVDQLIVTSHHQLEYLVSQCNMVDTSWLFSLKLYVPSQRIVQEAIRLGFQTAINVGSASNQDLVAALQPSNTGIDNDQ